MKRRIFLVGFAILLVLVQAGCSAPAVVTDPPTATVPADSTAAPTPAPKPTPVPTPIPTPTSSPYKLGTPFEVESVSYTLSFVDSLDTSAFGEVSVKFNLDVQMVSDANGNLAYSPADTSLKFVTVIVDITNKGTKAVDPLSLLTCTVKDSTSAVYNVAFSPVEAKAVETGESGKIALVFAVSKKTSALTLDMTPSLTETIQVPLQ